MSNFEISKSEFADKLQFRFLCCQDIEDLKKLCGEWFPIQYPNKWFQDVTSNKQYYSLAAIYEGRLIGVIISTVRQRTQCSKEDADILSCWYPTNTTVGYILIIGVVKEYRRHGVASLLLQSFLAHLESKEQRNCKAVYLHVLATNIHAILFYERQNFKRHKYLDQYYSIQGERMSGYSYVFYINDGSPPWSLRNEEIKRQQKLISIDEMIKRKLGKQYTQLFHICRRYVHTRKQRVCIVGSGPAGFYTAQHILKHNDAAYVDIFEKLPVPFGLVRYGVAPDHPEVKNATTQFEEVAQNERCRFYGNVNIGTDLKAKDLMKLYDAVVLAYGADDDKKLNIPGEDLDGVLSARAFVGWYNGLPAHTDLSPNLDCDTAVIFGQGNVSLDVARILLAPTDTIKHTDICAHALEALGNSKIKHVHIIGRRGPLQVSFTIKELREQIKLPGTQPVFPLNDLSFLKDILKDLPRPKKRLMELMYKTATETTVASKSLKKWQLHFLKSPSEILKDNHGKVCGVKLQLNKLVENEDGSVTGEGTEECEEIPCGLVLRSIGYKSIKVDEGVPFDIRMGVIPNSNGRIVQETGSNQIVRGLYCSGWVKHGPVGVIATTMNESFATAQNIVQDLKSGIRYVSFSDYLNIDNLEMQRGKDSEKPREKITTLQEMIDVAFRNKNNGSWK